MLKQARRQISPLISYDGARYGLPQKDVFLHLYQANYTHAGMLQLLHVAS